MNERMTLFALAGLVFLLACGLTLKRPAAKGKGGRFAGLDGESWLLAVLAIGSVGLLFWGNHA